jgi:Ricin-type beta-trefoil lectin domain
MLSRPDCIPKPNVVRGFVLALGLGEAEVQIWEKRRQDAHDELQRISRTEDADAVAVADAAHSPARRPSRRHVLEFVGGVVVVGAVAGLGISLLDGSFPLHTGRPRAWPSATVVFTDLSTSKCLDSNMGGNLYTLGCNGGLYQRWTVKDRAKSTVTLVDNATGRCLDSNANGSAYTLGCNGGLYQRWTAVPSSYGTVNLTNVATGRCLDSDVAGAVYTLGCNGGSYQRWVRD